MKKFKGENLRNLRILNSYTLRALAEVTDISEFELWQYENENKNPSFEHINILKLLFNVKAQYFYQSDLLSVTKDNINVDHISFRFLGD